MKTVISTLIPVPEHRDAVAGFFLSIYEFHLCIKSRIYNIALDIFLFFFNCGFHGTIICISVFFFTDKILFNDKHINIFIKFLNRIFDIPDYLT
ncbi:MAG: hypothetical protein PHS33_08970 [Candidatus Omnitrophica bacterium]|nr:hypothetical protein [Candidatus Omnitrophota bacterium]